MKSYRGAKACSVRLISISFGAFVQKWPVTRTWLVIERNQLKFGTSGTLVTRIWGTMGYICPCSIQGHQGHCHSGIIPYSYSVTQHALRPTKVACIANTN